MQNALPTLGYKSYHMIEALRHPKAFIYWLEALKAKYSDQGKPYQRVEFDKLLGNYSVSVIDFHLNLVRWDRLVEGLLTQTIQKFSQ